MYIHTKNYEKLSKFVEVTAKILSVPFFRTRCRRTVLFAQENCLFKVLSWKPFISLTQFRHGRTEDKQIWYKLWYADEREYKETAVLRARQRGTEQLGAYCE